MQAARAYLAVATSVAFLQLPLALNDGFLWVWVALSACSFLNARAKAATDGGAVVRVLVAVLDVAGGGAGASKPLRSLVAGSITASMTACFGVLCSEHHLSPR